jgi:hypothetical protein
LETTRLRQSKDIYVAQIAKPDRGVEPHHAEIMKSCLLFIHLHRNTPIDAYRVTGELIIIILANTEFMGQCLGL